MCLGFFYIEPPEIVQRVWYVDPNPNEFVQLIFRNKAKPRGLYNKPPVPIDIEALVVQVTFLSGIPLILGYRCSFRPMRENVRLHSYYMALHPDFFERQLLSRRY